LFARFAISALRRVDDGGTMKQEDLNY